MFLLMWLSQTVDDQQGGRTWNQENKINIKRLLPFITPAHTMYTSIKHFKEQTFNSKVVKFRTSKGTRFFLLKTFGAKFVKSSAKYNHSY